MLLLYFDTVLVEILQLLVLVESNNLLLLPDSIPYFSGISGLRGFLVHL